MAKKTGKIRISPTRLNSWFSSGCPHRWYLEKRYTPVELEDFFELGRVVHRIMEQDYTPTDQDSPLVAMGHKQAEKIREAIQLYSLEVEKEDRELYQEVDLTPDILLVRIIDAFAWTVEGERIILDYKTHGGRGWKQTETMLYPQGLGFQGSAYLIPPGPRRKWPERMFYLVAPVYGAQAQVVEFKRDPRYIKMFKEAAGLLAHAIRNKAYPKVYSNRCMECRVRPICFRESGWEEKFDVASDFEEAYDV